MIYHTDRPDRHVWHMRMAEVVAQRATCGRAQVGAIAVLDGRILVTGYNGPVAGGPHCSDFHCDISQSCTRAVHAEANLIAYSARYGIALAGTDIYSTHEPCINCARLLINANVKSVWYSIHYTDPRGSQALNEAQIPCRVLTDE